MTRFYENKIVLLGVFLFSLVLLSYGLPFLEPFRHHLLMYLRSTWWAVLLGLTLGGMMDYYIPQQYFSILAQSKKRTIFYSVFLGFFMSVCSHGILALAIQLYKKGASTPAVVAFLLASPWANLPLTLLLISFFGVAKALFLILAAIFIALTTGLIFQILERNGFVEKNKLQIAVDESFSIWQDMGKRFRNYRLSGEQIQNDFKGIVMGIASLSQMVLWWIILGIGLASLAGAYVPQEIFQKYMGPTSLGLVVTLLLATVLEVCSEGTSPLAFEIYKQTGAFGNSFVFLMAGVVTDYTEIGLIWQNIGRRAALWLPLVTVPQVILFGILANHIFKL